MNVDADTMTAAQVRARMTPEERAVARARGAEIVDNAVAATLGKIANASPDVRITYMTKEYGLLDPSVPRGALKEISRVVIAKIRAAVGE